VTNNWAVELFCCFAQHGIETTEGSALRNAGFDEIGETWIFPPALSLQYHFNPVNGFKPYFGVGAQYIHFFDTKSEEFGGTADIDDAFGFTLQAGADYEIGNGWYLNADIKKTWLETDVTIVSAGGNRITSDFDLDPLIVSFNLGYRFNLFKQPSPVPFK